MRGNSATQPFVISRSAADWDAPYAKLSEAEKLALAKNGAIAVDVITCDPTGNVYRFGYGRPNDILLKYIKRSVRYTIDACKLISFGVFYAAGSEGEASRIADQLRVRCAYGRASVRSGKSNCSQSGRCHESGYRSELRICFALFKAGRSLKQSARGGQARADPLSSFE